MHYEERNDDVLDCEEEVLAICREWEVVTIGVGERDSVRECFMGICSEREPAGGACGDNCDVQSLVSSQTMHISYDNEKDLNAGCNLTVA